MTSSSETPFRTVLITGGCGFLGQHLTHRLIQRWPHLQITRIDIKPERQPLFQWPTHAKVTTFDTLDLLTLDPKSIEPTDVVIHTAGLVSFAQKDTGALHRVNGEGTRVALKLAKHAKRFIHVSSVAALGYSDDPNQYATEDFRFDWSVAERHKKGYMLSKHRADVVVKEARSLGYPATIVYPGLMYGPGDFTNSVPFFKAICEGKVKLSPPGGTNVIDVRDVADGIISVLSKGIGGEDYLLSGHNLRLHEIISLIAKVANVKAPKLTLPFWTQHGLVPFWRFIEWIHPTINPTADHVHASYLFRYFSNLKAKEQLNWVPKKSFEQTVSDTLHWMESHGI